MRKVLVIAANNLIRTTRDRKALALLLLMPLIMIGILGAALNGMMEGGKINPFQVLIVNEDQPARPALPPGAPPGAAAQLPELHYGKLLVNEVFGNERIKRVVTSTTVSDLDYARAEVVAGRAVAVIHVPSGFSADTLSARPTQIKVLSDPGFPTQTAILLQVTEAFTESVSASVLTGQLTGASAVQTALPVLKEVPAATRSVSAMQYYAAAMSVMSMVMTAFGRAKDLIEERSSGTLSRILVSPISRSQVLAGQALGTVTVLLSQFALLMLGTRLFFGVHWGPWPLALALGAAFAVASAGIGLAAAAILNDARTADTMVGVAGLLFGSLSGGMFPLYAFPDTMKAVAKLIPNYWALQGLLDQMAGLGASTVWMPLSILAAIGLTTGAAGTWRLASR